MSHRRRGEDRWLEWKVRLFSVAAVLGLAGIYLEERWLTGAAIVVLGGGMGLRLLPGGGSMRDIPDEDLEDSEDPDNPEALADSEDSGAPEND